MHLIHMTLLLASGLLLFQIKTSHYFVFSYPTCLAHDIFPAWQGEAVLPFLLEPNQKGQGNAGAPLCALGLPKCWTRGGVSAIMRPSPAVPKIAKTCWERFSLGC